MCGIFAFAGSRGAAESIDLRGVGVALSHRGPDGSGQVVSHRVGRGGDEIVCALVHTRLSILDITEAAAQPMSTRDGRYTIVYNGEVYNFEAIRRELVAEGIEPQSTGDTEVVLSALTRWGPDAVRRFRGMFALALWDRETGSLLAVRDRLGIKPLYVSRVRGGIAVASEVRALLATGLVERRLSRAGVEGYLRYGSVQDPHTLVEGVQSLEPGRFLLFSEGNESRRRYWDFPTRAAKDMSFESAVDQVSPVLREAVRLHLVSDVPLGVFLSGGVDSSAIAAAAASQISSPLRTFTLTFDEEFYDESEQAAAASRFLGARHTDVHLGPKECVGEMDRVLESYDQPSADGINTWFVSKSAREAGLTVALSGLGGDEVFAGYSVFKLLGRLHSLQNAGWLLPRGVVRAVSRGAAAVPNLPHLERLADAILGEGTGALYRGLRCMFTDRQMMQLTGRAPAIDGAAESDGFAPVDDEDAVNAYSRCELQLYMRNTLLRDADAMSMRHSLEVRVPLVDHVLVETVLTIPGRLKLSRRRNKPLLVAASPDLPPGVATRPKRGFEVPLDVWFRSSLRGWIRDRLEGGISAAEYPLRSVEVVKLWSRFQEGAGVTAYRIWCLAALVDWCARHRIELPADWRSASLPEEGVARLVPRPAGSDRPRPGVGRSAEVAEGRHCEVTQFARQSGPRRFSLETHFERVRANLPPDVECSLWSCRFDSRGFWPRLLDGLRAMGHQGDVNHILGDIHFLALFLSGSRTLLNVADCVPLHRYIGLRRKLIRYFWYILPVRRVQLVSAISEATRQELLVLLGCEPSKIRVVHICISDRFRPAPRPFNKACPTILQVGTSASKNLIRLAEALSGLDCKLHVVGPLEADQTEALERFGLDWTGGETHDVHALHAAYERADVVAFASTYEGFGMPVVEAQTVERVVVAGDIPALREVGADAACFVDPFDPASIREGILRVIEDDAYRERLIENGRRNRERFDAARIAAQYADLYRIVAQSKRSGSLG